MSNSKLDAYELNLKQIQQTNEILYSIENKLNDVFLNQSPFKRKIDFNHYIGDSNIKRTPIQNNEDIPENPSFNIENNQNFLNQSTTKIFNPSEKKEKRSAMMKKYEQNCDFPLEYNNLHEKPLKEDNNYHSSIRMVEDCSANGRSLYSVDLKTKEELDFELKNLQKRLFLLEKENEIKNEELKTSRQKILYLENNLSSYKVQKNPCNDYEENHPRKKYDEFKDYNYAKIELLELKVKELNEENKAMIREKTTMLARIYELEQEARDKHKILKSFEAIKLEYEEKIANLSKTHNENNKQLIDEFKNEINNLTNKLNHISKEKEDYANHQRLLEKEKNKLNSSYSNLLNIHNQMLQLDIMKNEKNLQNSFCENKESSDSIRNSKKIIENLQSYKNEIEKLKASSFVSENYFKDLGILKEEIEKQRKENLLLMEEINKIKTEKKPEVEKIESEKMEKMQEYINNLEYAYRSIETKYNEQNNVNKEMKSNWKNMEEKNKDSYDKIEKIYKKFCEHENENLQINSQLRNQPLQKTIIPINEKIIMNSCPISTKSGIPTPESKTKSMMTLMKTRKIGVGVGSTNSLKPISKTKRSNSNNNLKKK